ncbi:MAG: sugar phosphorylase [Spirochaetia bacterium]|nr:sugar phosphorylase [Spirochaetia bacterium]
MTQETRAKLVDLLSGLYGPRAMEAAAGLEARIEAAREARARRPRSEGNAAALPSGMLLISYGDSLREEGRAPLSTLRRFLDGSCADFVDAVHVLPFYPSTSDDGFSVADWRAVDPALGTWDDVAALAEGRGLMVDAVLNHVSASNPWFEAFRAGKPPHDRWFRTRDPAFDASKVARPRALPLFTRFETADGDKDVWTTFSADQVDLDYANPEVLLEAVSTLLFYAARGASLVRLDAIGYAWKESGTSCLNLPGAHAIVKAARLALDEAGTGTRLVTETNVPHAENVAYFGAGDEAHLVYQFPLPPLVLHAFLSGSAERLSAWLGNVSRERLPEGCAFFNFLASHDGIGLRPTEGILDDEGRRLLVEAALERGGDVGWRDLSGGGRAAYELNVNYLDALSPPGADDGERAARTEAAHAILLALDGVAAVYIHSLLGSRNWKRGVEESGIKRRINREKLDWVRVREELAGDGLRAEVFHRLARLARVRKSTAAFAVGSPQEVLALDGRVLAFARGDGRRGRALCLANVSDGALELEAPFGTRDLLTGERVDPRRVRLEAKRARWLGEAPEGDRADMVSDAEMEAIARGAAELRRALVDADFGRYTIVD